MRQHSAYRISLIADNVKSHCALIVRGFTVVELTLYMGLLGIFLVVMTQLFVSSLDIQLESEATSAVQLDGSYLLSRMTYDLLRADSITTPSASGETTDTLVFVSGGETYTYSLVDGVLSANSGSGSTRLNSVLSAVSDLTFERGGNPGGNPTIRIVFTLTSVAELARGSEVKTFQTTISAR